MLPASHFLHILNSEEDIYTSGLNRWRIDLTVYNPKILPNGELPRSKGHTNRQSVEVFEVLKGKVRIYLENEDKNKVDGYYSDLSPGEFMYVPAGWYHSTHIIQGPAAVLDMVNCEGFLDWKHKGYRIKQSHCTFYKRGKVIKSHIRKINSGKQYTLTKIKPFTAIPFSNSNTLVEHMKNSSEEELITHSNKLISTKHNLLIKSRIILP